MDSFKKLAKNTVQIENEKAKVVRWSFEPDSSTGWHEHNYDYIVIPLVDGQLTLKDELGETIVRLSKGVPYFKPEGIKHDVFNSNTFDFEFIEIELKQ